MPVGELVTVPEPVPDFETVRVWTSRVNVAVTKTVAFIVTTQVPIPEQPPPDQPVKFDPGAGVAVKVTTVPRS